MSLSDKCTLLNDLIEAFGYEYICKLDVFSTPKDAWQRSFGYTKLFDVSAPSFNMVFDCEPIYFNHNNRTWLIELWKGQYGINTGGEIGIYYSDHILKKEEYSTEIFQAVADEDMLDMTMTLSFQDSKVSLAREHWWLTLFSMGKFTNPSEIKMYAKLSFPNLDMLNAFYEAAVAIGYTEEEICICGNDIFLIFTKSHSQHISFFGKMRRYLVQRRNLLLCHIFLHATRPLETAVDQILLLYYYLPSIFRNAFKPRSRYKRQRK